MPTKSTLSAVLVGAALAAAGCGGSSSSGTPGGTGTVAGTVATVSTSTTARASASFNVQFGKVQRQLERGLRQLENGNMAGAGAVLRNCQDTVTSRLGARAQTSQQQQAVSGLRSACDDVSKASAAFRSGNTTAAGTYAKKAYTQVKQAGAGLK